MTREPRLTRGEANAQVATEVINAMLTAGRLQEQSTASYDVLLRFLAEGSASAAETNNQVFICSPSRGSWIVDNVPWEGYSLCIHPSGQKTFWSGIVDRTKSDFGTGIDASLEDTIALAYAYAVHENKPYYVTGVFEEEGENFYQTAWAFSASKPEDNVWIYVSQKREAWIETDIAVYPGLRWEV